MEELLVLLSNIKNPALAILALKNVCGLIGSMGLVLVIAITLIPSLV
jgi:hypothetical protein